LDFVLILRIFRKMGLDLTAQDRTWETGDLLRRGLQLKIASAAASSTGFCQ